MKKLLALLLTLSTVAQVSAGGCNTCSVAKCEPAPICSKLVTKEIRKPARKICETNCHYECPTDCTRTDRQAE